MIGESHHLGVICIGEGESTAWYDLSLGFIKQGDKEMQESNSVTNTGKESNVVTNDNKPQAGAKIRCINTGGYDFLTSGEIYIVEDASSEGFAYMDNDGDEVWYSFGEIEREVFEIVEEEMEESSEVMNEKQEDQKQDEFQVGNKVWCAIYGPGKVIDIENDMFPIRVEFSTRISSYTKDGRWDTGVNRTLFFSEPKIEAAVTRPFVSTLVGKRVVVVTKPTGNQAVGDVVRETEDRLYFTEEDLEYYYDKSDLTAVYEVSSENLLKK